MPESVVASFVKKLARLSLTAPPNGTLLCVKMAINVTKRHSLQYLIHREHNETVVSFLFVIFTDQLPDDNIVTLFFDYLWLIT